MSKTVTKYIEVEKLTPHPQNPRKISHKELEKLCKSIKKNPEYFEARPIICDAALTVYAGNMRLKAAIKLGMDKVPVCVMNLPEEKMQEIMIRDNISNGEWDSGALAEFDINDLVEYGMNFTDSVMKNELNEGEEMTEAPKEKKAKVKKSIICENCGHEISL